MKKEQGKKEMPLIRPQARQQRKRAQWFSGLRTLEGKTTGGEEAYLPTLPSCEIISLNHTDFMLRSEFKLPWGRTHLSQS